MRFISFFLFYAICFCFIPIRTKKSRVDYGFRSRRINAISTVPLVRVILDDQIERAYASRVFLRNRRITAFAIGTSNISSLCLYSHDGRRLWSVGNNGDKNSSNLFCTRIRTRKTEERIAKMQREKERERTIRRKKAKERGMLPGRINRDVYNVCPNPRILMQLSQLIS